MTSLATRLSAWQIARLLVCAFVAGVRYVAACRVDRVCANCGRTRGAEHREATWCARFEDVA